MTDTVLTSEEFEELARSLFGLVVSLPWKGYGSAIFFELGSLSPLESKRRHHNKGEACIAVQWDWRVEAEAAVLYGSSNSRPTIEAGVLTLQGTTVESVAVVGHIPELVVHFSNGHCLRTMVMVTGDPEWSVKLPDGKWIYARSGRLIIGSGAAAMTNQEVAVFARAERVTTRWGRPRAVPQKGFCSECASFVPIDGDGHLLDYGCCTADAGPFDGRAVARTSGCPFFTTSE